MRGLVWIVVAVGVVPGCFDTPQEVLDDIVCQKVVACFPAFVDQERCLQLLAPVSEECFDFATTNALDCGAIDDAVDNGGVCEPDFPDPGPD
jgi:hypothetical protein